MWCWCVKGNGGREPENVKAGRNRRRDGNGAGEGQPAGISAVPGRPADEASIAFKLLAIIRHKVFAFKTRDFLRKTLAGQCHLNSNICAAFVADSNEISVVFVL